ncbi:hypothetical protein [Stappia sp. P2PMeth1]|uniref:hypothetical protein n=1 Tax=Stappia sp. P2PMeth1 TaxID=2003586 RepID=UPI001644E644|nr:hypothetical protein [Stappia sp. P2PMeth1]
MHPVPPLAALLLAVAFGGPAVAEAATVKTERIQVAPSEDPADGTRIPSDALETPAAPPEPATDASGAPGVQPEALPEVLYGEADLPKPVARTRSQLLEAAYAGDLERLRMVLEANEMMPTLTFGEMDDPIEFLKASSGDGEGLEVMAILTEILEAGYVHVDKGTAQEMYVWPYFSRIPLARLTREQKVEMYRVVTSGDLADMEAMGAWTFYRVGIGPDGTLHYFVAGD